MASTDSPWRDPETLRRLYRDEGRSLADVADRLGCSDVTVLDWLDPAPPGSPDRWEVHSRSRYRRLRP